MKFSGKVIVKSPAKQNALAHHTLSHIGVSVIDVATGLGFNSLTMFDTSMALIE